MAEIWRTEHVLQGRGKEGEKTDRGTGGSNSEIAINSGM